MAGTINLTQETALPTEEVIKRVTPIIDDLALRYGLAGEWHSRNVFCFSREGVEGNILIRDGAVDVSATLGLLLGPFASMIEQQIRDQLLKAIG